MKNLKQSCIELDFSIEQYPTESISHYSYFVHSDDDAVIIDPITEPCLYLTLLQETQTTLKYVFLTHKSIDFISGCEELSKITGAKIIQSNDQVSDNTKFNIGTISLTLQKTSGFTSDSCCYVLANSKNKNRAVFTGGLILYGDIGRPIESHPNYPSSNVVDLFISINKITQLTVDNCKLLFYPAYSDGAFFKPNIQEDASPFLLEQMKTNKYLTMDKETFIQEMETTPLYQVEHYIKNIQQSKLTANTKEIIENTPKLSVEDVENHIKNEDVYVLDTRDQWKSSRGYIPNSIIASLKIGFNKYIPSLLSTNSKIILVTETNMLNDSVLSCIRLGYQNILGYLNGGFPEWKKASKPKSKVGYHHSIELDEIIKKGGNVIDVREIEEFKSDGIVKESILIPLTELSERIKDVPLTDKLYILCKSGARSTLASTYLTRIGNKSKMIVLMGGCMELKADGYPLIKYSK